MFVEQPLASPGSAKKYIYIKVQKKLNFTFNYKTKQELLKETKEYIALMRDLEYYVFY